MTPTLNALLAGWVGKRIGGGCLDCLAYQTVRRDPDGVWRLTTHHDDTCPVWQAMQS